MTDSPAPHHAADVIPEAAITAGAHGLWANRNRNAAAPSSPAPDFTDRLMAHTVLTAAWPHLVAALAAAPPPPDHAECIAEHDQLREHFRAQFPPCPRCGCRTSEDADSRECGCDAGCNDGQYPPGVNVLLANFEHEREIAAYNAGRRAALLGGAADEPVDMGKSQAGV